VIKSNQKKFALSKKSLYVITWLELCSKHLDALKSLLYALMNLIMQIFMLGRFLSILDIRRTFCFMQLDFVVKRLTRIFISFLIGQACEQNNPRDEGAVGLIMLDSSRAKICYIHDHDMHIVNHGSTKYL